MQRRSARASNDQHVFRLQVPVDDGVAVRLADRVANLIEPVGHDRGRQDP